MICSFLLSETLELDENLTIAKVIDSRKQKNFSLCRVILIGSKKKKKKKNAQFSDGRTKKA